MGADRIPVTVITGYLGAGKTTLLNRILREPQRERYAILINEFSDLGIDADLVVRTDEEIIELTNGCLCCTIRNDLVGALRALARRRDTFSALLIETSGVSDPAAVAHTLLLEDVHRFDGLQLDGIVTVVDAANIERQLDASDTAANQVALADVLLINKAELQDGAGLARIRGRLEALNALAEVVPCRQCDAPLERLLGRSSYAFERAPRFSVMSPAHVNTWNDDPITSVALRSSRPLDADEFLEWMSELLRTSKADLLRAKGFVAFTDEARKFVFHGVMGVMDGDAQAPWQADEPRESRLVFIGRNLDRQALQRGFEGCLR